MQWLRFNDQSKLSGVVKDVIKDFSKFECVFNKCLVNMVYDQRIWDSAPYSKLHGQELVICGWFIFDGELNNLASFHKGIFNEGLKCVLQKIEYGVFIGILKDEHGGVTIFNDWFGLSSHYYTVNGEFVSVAPSAKQLNDEVDDKFESLLKTNGHLWGGETKYKNVKKMLPGTLMTAQGVVECYVNFSVVKKIEPENIPKYIQENMAIFKKDSKHVALSAGFDSRMIAIHSDCSASYCWGPERSKDIRNAATIARNLSLEHHAFRFKSVEIENLDCELSQWLLDGQVENINHQFGANYRYASNLLPKQFISLDGYLGDVLQRGVYLNYGGMRGELRKLMPNLLDKNEDGVSILKKRYSRISSEEFDEFLCEYILKCNALGLQFDKLQLATIFEFIYGRGFSYISAGGIIRNGIWNVVVPVFASPVIFKACIGMNSAQLMNYKHFKRVWSQVDSKLSCLLSEGVYSPRTARFLIPWLNLFGRILTNYIPYYHNYGRE
ncbi:hypothetical protein VST7929_02199 [Vibrio stylophorae]|uniref:Asparagine synthase n=1 Tax=Vibrio stylophorae TaxID=659351 RepID=A0ABM8ZVF4_9VIBR|nr:hypothetical protein [Vibrio stylophorae]CAH0534283.1 hypothetical protein VST7929_02199 [Vibrio stylophorae]